MSEHRCMWCNRVVADEPVQDWWRVWADGSGRRKVEGYTHFGRCTEMVNRRYELTDAERAEWHAYHERAGEGGGE